MLRRLFSRNRRKNPSTLGEDGLDHFLLSQHDFATRLRQESMRSERSGLDLSLVVVDCAGLLGFSTQTTGNASRDVFRRIKKVLKTSTRESDIKGWYQNGKIGVLTPDTNLAGARALAKNLTREIAAHLGSEGSCRSDDYLLYMSISSLKKDGSYLAGDRGRPTRQSPSPHDHYRFEFSAVAPDSAGATNVAVMEWPFSLEVLNRAQLRKLELTVKRVFDVIASVVGLLLSAPLLLVVAVLIKLTSPGPILFRQQRLGFLGKPFTFLKFRSMRVDCDPSLHKDYVTRLIKGENEAINKGTAERPIYKMEDDPRVTPVGKFLRKTSLDELPQFLSVLKGDMSLVGPRPPIPYECDQYQPWHCRRVLEVKPGITGLWQVSGRSRTTFDEMVRLDLCYVRNWSLWLDLKIILKTFWAVISMRGGY